MAERIRRWRKSKGLNKKELAMLVGRDPSTVTLWERGEPPGFHSMVIIAGVMGVPLSTFFSEIPDDVEGAA